MAKHLLLMVHGMGLHGDDWIAGEQGPQQTLTKAAQRYAYFKNRPLTDLVEFVPISYDEIFKSVVKQWQTDATAFAQTPGNTLGGAVNWLSTAAETEKNFWWTHAADVALYRCFPTYREMVRAEIQQKIVDQIAPRLLAGEKANSILAHSLGTAVTHDTLHRLGSISTVGGDPNALQASQFHWRNIIMIANVSRLLQNTDQGMETTYKSIVRPGDIGDPDSYCLNFINARHEADPFTYPRMFEPVGWDPEIFTNVLIRHYWQANVHDVSHYLLHPRVHIPILRGLTKKTAITKDEEEIAVNQDNFPQIGGSFAFVNKVTALADRFEKLKQELGDDPSNATLTKAFTAYATAVREAA